MNTRKHSMNSKKRSQVNQFFLYPGEKENSEWKQILQDTL